MGNYTLWPLVFSLTMLNVRLNYWAPNPSWANRDEAEEAGPESTWDAVKRALRRMRLRVASPWYLMKQALGWGKLVSGANPTYLVREALGKVTGVGKMVNLSDGGHVENLGVYELLRRRCRMIVAVDAEEDSTFGFSGLGTLAQFASIDLQTEIRFNGLSKIGRDGPWSGRHWALGTIDYPDAPQGYLLYLKASLTGDEGPGPLAYAVGTDFPHESTSDQSFSEEQFEAYRSLGQHIGESAIAELEEAGEISGLFPDYGNAS